MSLNKIYRKLFFTLINKHFIELKQRFDSLVISEMKTYSNAFFAEYSLMKTRQLFIGLEDKLNRYTNDELISQFKHHLTEMSFLCLIFRFCCPCFYPKEVQTKKSKEKIKSPKRSPKTEMDTSDWMRQTSKVDPELIKDEDLTKEYKVPDQDYKTTDECVRAHGFVIDKSNRLCDSQHSVFGAVIKASGVRVACKVVTLSEDNTFRDRTKFRSLKRELYVLAHGKRHKNIIEMIDNFIVTDDNYKQQFCYIFMELANGGTLANKLIVDSARGQKVVPLTEKMTKIYFRQIADGMDFLHTNNIAHKDLKLTNILIVIAEDRKEIIKISDFGISGIRFDSEERRVIKEVKYFGTEYYVSPQLLRLYVYDLYQIKLGQLHKVDPYVADMWSLGVCLFVMISGHYPFGISKHFLSPTFGDSLEELTYVYNSMKVREYAISDSMKKNISSDCFNLINHMLEPDVNARLRIKDVLHHKWLRE